MKSFWLLLLGCLVWFAPRAGGLAAAAPPPAAAPDAAVSARQSHPVLRSATTATAAPPSAPGNPQPRGGTQVVATNLGKGDWIWQMPQTMTRLGVSTTQGVINYEAGLGMQWITVKCGDGTNIWSQFTSNLVAQAHAAGLRIFGWAYAYGYNPTQVRGEIAVAVNALNLGADGFIIDAEIEYETNAANATLAAQYCQGIRAAAPNTFLAYAPFPYIHYHSGYPYAVFGYYSDAAMPQDYWGAFGISPAQMVTDMDTDWRNWQNGLTGTNRNAIKPIVPLAQSYSPVTGAQITAFLAALQADTSPAGVGGYHGVSFWDCQSRNADMDAAVGAATVGTGGAPVILTNPGNRSVDAGSSVTLPAGAQATPTPALQWLFNGAALRAATNASLALTNVQPAQTGAYALVASNLHGAVTSAVAQLTVNATPALVTVWRDDFETNSAANWVFYQGSVNNVPDYNVAWGYDYSTNTFTFNGLRQTTPVAPGTTNGTRLGLRLAVNKSDNVAADAGVSLYPLNRTFTGDYVLRFDLWLNYNGNSGGGVGSTEYATFGLNHTGNGVNWGAGTVAASDGLWFALDGDGGALNDYLAYAGNPAGNPVSLAWAAGGFGANGAASQDSLDPFFQSLFPSPAYETAGAAGKHWLQGEVSQVGGLLTWRLNGTVVAQRTNTTTFTNGTIMLGFMDLFPSIANPAADNYGIFDNVRVLIPTAAAVPQIRPAGLASGNRPQIAVGGYSGATYVVENSADLSHWTAAATFIAGASATNLVLPPLPGAARQFYRVRLGP